MTKKRIILHGYLKKLWSGPAEYRVATVAEAIKAFCVTTKALNIKPGQARHRIAVRGFDSRDALFAPTDETEIHLYPAFVGGKNGGFLQILIGAALVAASFFIPGGWAIGSIALSSMALSMGAAMVLGGLIQVLAPQPTRDDTGATTDPEASKYLGAPGNTVAVGTRIPIGYGTYQVYGHYISFDIDAKDVSF